MIGIVEAELINDLEVTLVSLARSIEALCILLREREIYISQETGLRTINALTDVVKSLTTIIEGVNDEAIERVSQ